MITKAKKCICRYTYIRLKITRFNFEKRNIQKYYILMTNNQNKIKYVNNQFNKFYYTDFLKYYYFFQLKVLLVR